MPWVHDLDPGQHLVRIVIRLVRGVGDDATPAVVQANQVYLDLVGRATEAYPDQAMVWGAAAGLARRMNAVPQAVRWGPGADSWSRAS